MAHTTVNEDFLDALIRHQIGLMRLSGSIRNRILKILDATEKDLRREIAKRATLNRDGTLSAARLRVLDKLVRRIRGAAWDKVTTIWLEELVELAKAEPKFLAMAASTVSPVVLDTVLPSVSTLRAIVSTKPFEGRVLKRWAANIARADIERITGSIRIGMIQGEGPQSIARRIVGTARLRGADGVTAITRRNAAALTRTAVTAISNQAKRAFYEENKDIFEMELYVATLDARTTPICRSLDGETFPIGEGPIPPLHFACRSLRVANFDDDDISRRPTKSSTDKQLLREFTEKEGLPKVSSRGALPRGTRGPFDIFSRARVRELTGTVPAKVDYGEFLRRQSVEFQNEVLGVTKARLFRRGGLDLDRFVNRQGDELTLAQLAQSDAGAFRAAGLDPDDFL